MTRISSAMLPKSSIADLSRAQRELAEAARQSSAQTRAEDLKGYGRDAQTLVSTQRLLARTQSFLDTSRELQSRMDLQEIALSRAGGAVEKLKQALFESATLETGQGVRAQLEEAFSVIRSSMNTSLSGRYLFGGVVDDRPPVAPQSLGDLAGQPFDDALVRGAAPQAARIEDNLDVDVGVVAEDVVDQALASIRRLAILDGGPDGPFSAKLSSVQKQALMDEVTALSQAFEQSLSAQSAHGRLMRQVEDAAERQTAHRDILKNAIGEITDVDLAEVAVRLNQAQFAYEASAGVFATLRGLSLLNVLR